MLAAGCVVLWFYLDAYEATLPGHVMDEFTELADEAYWSDALEGAFTVGETPFEDRDELLEELCLSVLRSNPLEYREDEGYSADNMVYLVSAGGRDVCRVTVDELTENGNAGFGFTYLAVTRVELLASFTAPEQYEIDITAPADAAVYVNGVLVTPEYAVSAGEITAEGLGELEEGLADELFTAYHIGGLYAPVEVSAAGADGSALAAEGELRTMPSPSRSARARSTTASSSPRARPSASTASSSTRATTPATTIVPAFLDGFEIYGTLPELELWLVEGLHVEPEITVTAAGGEMGESITDGSELVYLSGADSATESAHREEAAALRQRLCRLSERRGRRRRGLHRPPGQGPRRQRARDRAQRAPRRLRGRRPHRRARLRPQRQLRLHRRHLLRLHRRRRLRPPPKTPPRTPKASA